MNNVCKGDRTMKMKKRSSRKKTDPLHSGSGYLFLVLPLLVYAVFFILPNLSSLVYSLFSWNGISAERTFVGLKNFRQLFADRVFRTALINTVKYTVALVVFQTLIGFVLAVLVQKTNRINSVFRTVYFLPAIIAASTVGLIWGFIYDPNMGALNELFRLLGLNSWRHSWLSEPKIVIYAITAVHVWVGIGQSVVLFVAGLQNVPQDVLESASLDGAGSWKQLTRIVIPLLRPTTLIVLVLTTIGGFKSFDFVYVMTGGGATHSSEVLSTLLYKEAYAYSNYGASAAISVVLLVIVSVITVVQMYGLREKE